MNPSMIGRFRSRLGRGAALQLGLLGLCGLCGSGLTARAAGTEWMLDAGASMLRYARASHLDAPRTVQINGAALHVISGSTDDPLARVLDAFQERCRAGGADFGLLRSLPAAGLQAVTRAGARAAFEPVLRAQDAERGFLGCLDPGADALSSREWLERLQAFARSGDLATLGDLRFVWAMRDGSRTSYVALWSAGSLRLAQLFPAEGDAPGTDAPGIPRPPESRRLLSAFVQDAAPMLVAYRAQLPPAQFETLYRGTLIDGGFAVRAAPARERLRGEARALSIEHPRTRARALVVVSAVGADASAITLLPLP